MSIEGFIQQLAVAYVANGYFFYVTGYIPPDKEARAVDAKLIKRYGIDNSKWVRCRKKAKGFASLQYLRFRQFFLLMATAGEHEFFHREKRIDDVRRKPIQCFGYSVGCKKGSEGDWHPSVRIERKLFAELTKELERSAVTGTIENLGAQLHRLPFEPYAPIRSQILKLLRTVNGARLRAGVEPVSVSVLRLKRCPVSPFRVPASPGIVNR